MTYRLREVNLSILPKGSPTIRVLHFSDLHLTPSRKREISIIRSWVDLKPDLVISTGDFLGHRDAIQPAILALDPLLDIPGLYVFGSNDYYGPRFKNPLSYLKRDDGTRKLGS
ncbi:MAG: metallophosphoesterase, partial [Candidatus Nanopelagicaceae bacterium]